MEYEKLMTVDDGYTPDPNRSIAVVAENGHHIIGRIFLIAPAHCEGIFVEPAWRGGPVMKRLVDAIEIEARAEGISRVYAYAVNEEMEGYISRLGYTKVPMTVWKKDLATT